MGYGGILGEARKGRHRAAPIWCGNTLRRTMPARGPSRATGTLLDSPATPDRASARHFQELVVLNSKAFDDIAARIGKAIENSPAKDIEKNVKAMLASSVAKLDLVPRAEFDVQAQVLLKTRAKLDALEKRITELEARIGTPSA